MAVGSNLNNDFVRSNHNDIVGSKREVNQNTNFSYSDLKLRQLTKSGDSEGDFGEEEDKEEVMRILTSKSRADTYISYWLKKVELN
jgi:hypothetical protein